MPPAAPAARGAISKSPSRARRSSGPTPNRPRPPYGPRRGRASRSPARHARRPVILQEGSMDTGSIRSSGIARGIDLEKYRLRRFVERLIDMGEVDVHDDPVPLAALSEIIEANERAQFSGELGPNERRS